MLVPSSKYHLYASQSAATNKRQRKYNFFEREAHHAAYVLFPSSHLTTRARKSKRKLCYRFEFRHIKYAGPILKWFFESKYFVVWEIRTVLYYEHSEMLFLSTSILKTTSLLFSTWEFKAVQRWICLDPATSGFHVCFWCCACLKFA